MSNPDYAAALQNHLAFVRQHSPYYRQAWKGLPDSLSLGDLPVTDLGDYWAANSFRDNRLLTAPHQAGVVFKSGGTTGNPKFSYFSNEDWQAFCHVFGQGMRRAGLQPGERVANIFYGGQLYASLLFITRCIEEAGQGVSFPISGSAPAEELIDALVNFEIQTLAGVPTTLVSLLPALAEQAKGQLKVRRFIYGGETMYPDQIAALQKVLPDCQVASIGIAGVDYGEMGWVDESCEPGVHRCFDESTVLEILAEDGQPVNEVGVEGDLHITNFQRRLMPIVRYPVGDRGMWIDPPDSPSRRFRVLGRSETGARVGPMTLYLDDMQRILQQQAGAHGVIGFQLLVDHHQQKDAATLRVAVMDPHAIPGELAERVCEAVYAERHMYGDLIAGGIVHPLQVEWVASDALLTNPRTGKLMRLVDRRLQP